MRPRRKAAPASRVRKGVEDFLSSANTSTNRGTCLTCRVGNRQEIEQAVLHFARRRADGSTHVTFRTFVKMHVRTALGYPGHSDSLRRHMEQCCGKQIP